MSKKFLPVLLVLTVASLFVAFQTQGREGDNPKTKNEKILRNVGLLLEQGHYSPKNINDSFSKQVLNRFVKDLDADKSIFLQSDIDSFSKYNNRIDDEIHGAKLESFYAINDSYTRRLNQASKYFIDLLSKPFDYTKDENVLLDGDKLRYPKTEADKKEVWRKRLKYMVLSKYADMLDDREANKDKKQTAVAADSLSTIGKAAPKKFVYKVDSTLEREARGMIKKQIDRYFTTLKTHNTNDELFSVFVNAITGEMDPHSSYFAPVDSRGFNEMMSGKFYGIGAQLKEDESKIKIASLITGMPAWKSGEIGVNDEVIKIGQGNAEPVDVTGYAVTDAVKLIRGSEAGTEVRLTVRKPDGSIKIVSLKRGEIKLDDTFAKSAIIKGEHKIGYIYLPEFYMDFEKPNGAKCSEDVAKEIVKLKAENVEGIVIDLRGNGGGSLPEVVKMAGLFIEDGPICQVRGRDEKQPYLWKDRDKSILYSGPLTVMVDEGSASASEIFAAAIQDYKRGIIIGSSSTYGKGTVQRTIPLNPEAENPALAKTSEDLGTVKLTLQKFYRINGGATQLKGVTPDVVIPDRYEFFKSREKDNDAALSWDEIGKAEYHPWVSTYSTNAVINAANQQVNTSPTFKNMKQQVEWIDKKNDKEVSLNLVKYKADLQQMKVAYKQLDSLYKLPKELNVLNSPSDTVGFGADKDKRERNKQFLNRIKGDVYIDETVKVMNNMINQTNVALNAAGAAESSKKY
ncbi:carboxy terminal-processing peptidase [Ferruginibacter sp.]|uniref:carboxy terminal-processing peptidase n=2 Tax=Ferruginibacter sp. TaxID=1940288 RepID=UPI0026594073|nr:carboxy terminal-processing peptidase [Ferruginibacter sp.]